MDMDEKEGIAARISEEIGLLYIVATPVNL